MTLAKYFSIQMWLYTEHKPVSLEFCFWKISFVKVMIITAGQKFMKNGTKVILSILKNTQIVVMKWLFRIKRCLMLFSTNRKLSYFQQPYDVMKGSDLKKMGLVFSDKKPSSLIKSGERVRRCCILENLKITCNINIAYKHSSETQSYFFCLRFCATLFSP